MLLEIDHHSGLPLYRQVMDQIRRQILTGQLPPGSQLISVRDLAAQLKVNPMTVSKAYAYLEMESLVERQKGVGLFVAEMASVHKEQKGLEILEAILRKAAIAAAQLDIPHEQAVEVFEQLCRQYDGNMRRSV